MTDRLLCRVTTEPLAEAELTAFVTLPEAGGIVLFSGVVRNEHEGREVTRIEYTTASGLAETKLRAVCEEVLADERVLRVAAIHRVGLLEVGEASVMVAASAGHREAAFAATRQLIDRVKEIVPVWKHEHFADGTVAWAPGFAVAEADRAPGPGGPPDEST